MIWIIVKKELLENLTTYRFFILTGMLLVLMVVSIIISYGDYELRMEDYNINRPKPNSSNILIPPNPVSIFAKGADANLGRLHYVGESISVQSNQQSINRLFSLFTLPDMLFIIKVVLSLIALMFSFDAITGEKESGTMKLTLASGSSRMSMLFGKLIGRFLLVFMPFFILFLVTAVVASLLPEVESTAYYWQRVTFLALASAMYVATFAALGLLLSSLVYRSSSSLILCLSVWVFFVFVVPQMGTAAAKSIVSIPPSERINLQGRLTHVRAQYEQVQHEKTTGRGKEYLRYLQDMRDANRAILESYRPKLNELIRLTKNILRLSPPGAFTFLITDGLNTGTYEELRFKDAVSLYVDRNFDLIHQITKGSPESFQYRRASLSEAFVQSAVTDVVVLVLFLAGFVALAIARFGRYDTR